MVQSQHNISTMKLSYLFLKIQDGNWGWVSVGNGFPAGWPPDDQGIHFYVSSQPIQHYFLMTRHPEMSVFHCCFFKQFIIVLPCITVCLMHVNTMRGRHYLFTHLCPSSSSLLFASSEWWMWLMLLMVKTTVLSVNLFKIITQGIKKQHKSGTAQKAKSQCLVK